MSTNAERLRVLADSQCGAVSRHQLRGLGFTDGWIHAQLFARRWSHGLPGVYVTHTGPRSEATRVWIGLLYAGSPRRGSDESMSFAPAVASHETAAWLGGLREQPSEVVHVTVPSTRRVRRQPGVAVHYSAHLAARAHPARTPPQTRLEDTILDLSDERDDAIDVIGLLTTACQRRLTSAARLSAAAARRKKLRWRQLIGDVLADVTDGIHSALELAWGRDVIRRHGLPRGVSNRAEGPRGHRRYRDVRYAPFRLVVELDGRAAHPDDHREDDMARDRDLLEAEDCATMRYGWAAVVGAPCAAAAQMAVVLARRGWTGVPRKCGPSCPVTPPAPPA